MVEFDVRLLESAHALVIAYPLRTLAALNLAALIDQVQPLFGEVSLVSCDSAQRDVAAALGVPLARF